MDTATTTVLNSGWVLRTIQAVLVAVVAFVLTAYFSWRIKGDPMLIDLVIGTMSLLMAGGLVLGIPWTWVFLRSYFNALWLDLKIAECNSVIADGIGLRDLMLTIIERRDADAWDGLRFEINEWFVWQKPRVYKVIASRIHQQGETRLAPLLAIDEWPEQPHAIEHVQRIDDWCIKATRACAAFRESSAAVAPVTRVRVGS